MNTCEYYQELISRMLDDELTNQERMVLAEHLSICSECASMYRAFSMLSDAMATDLVEPPEELAEDIMAHIRRAEMRKRNQNYSRSRRALSRQVRNLVAAAACVAVVVAAVGGVAVVNNRRSDNAIYESRLSRDTASGTTTSEGGVLDATILAPEPEQVQAPLQENGVNAASAMPESEGSSSQSWNGASQSWWGLNDGWFSTPQATVAPTPPVYEIVPQAPVSVPTPSPTPFVPEVFKSEEAPIVVITPPVTQAPVISEAPLIVVTPGPVPAVVETPDVVDIPAVVETPVAAEAPTAFNTPAVTDTPDVFEPSAFQPSVFDLPTSEFEESAGLQPPMMAEVPTLEEAPFVDEFIVTEDTPPVEESAIASVPHTPLVSHDFSQLDCTEFVDAIFGLTETVDGTEAAVDMGSELSEPAQDNTTAIDKQYDAFVDKILSEHSISLCTLPEGIEPDMVEMAAFSQDGLYFMLQVEIYGDQVYIFTYDSQGQEVCFQSPISPEEYNSFVEECYTLLDLE